MVLLGQETSLLELTGTIFGLIGVWLTVKQNVWCYPSGIVNVGLYAILFFQAKLYADASLQIIYIILLVYGWIRWTTAKNEGFVATRITARMLLALIIVAVFFTLIVGYIFKVNTDASLPYLDSSLTAASLIAQWMIAKKKIENWLIWIAADVVYIGMYIYKHLYLTSVLYAIFIPLAIVGWMEWRKHLKVKSEK